MATKTEREQILLLQQETKYMNEKIDKNHEEVMWAIWKVESFLEKLPNTFATKQEHKINADKIDSVKESNDRIWKIIWWVIGFVFTGLFTIIGATLIFFIKSAW